MDRQNKFCHNPSCPARGQRDQGTIRIHSRKEHRYRCIRCGHTLAATTGAPFQRLHRAVDLMIVVVTLLSHGCPPQAIMATIALHERTAARWQARAG